MKVKVNIKIDDLELRSCDTHDVEHKTMEIVKWFESGSCYTVAYWLNPKDDTPSLKFVGDRPLKRDKNSLYSLIEIGYRIFNEGLFDNEEKRLY